MSAKEHLLSDYAGDSTHKHAGEPHCPKWVNYLCLPLDCVIYPLTSCMRSSCWEKRRHAQYDLALQTMGIFQTLIGALLASSIVAIIEHFEASDSLETAYIAIYVGATYCTCNIMVVMMQRNALFNERMEFFLGTMGHIVAFGVKALLFQIMNLHFSATFSLAISYFFLCLIGSITMIWGLSFIRKNFCFAIKEIHHQTEEIRHKISNKADALGNQISNAVDVSLQKVQSIKSSNEKREIYESDIMEKFLDENDQNDPKSVQQKASSHSESAADTKENKEQHEKESFNDLIKEIDTDAFSIAMGGIFCEIALYAVNGFYIQLDQDEGSQDEEGENILDSQPLQFTVHASFLNTLIFLFFYLFNQLVSYIQMKRDRALHKMFQSLSRLSSKSINSNNENEEENEEIGDNENCFLRCCMRFSYKSYKLSGHIITYIVGFLGWAWGWSVVTGAYATEDVLTSVKFSLIVTFVGILLYFLRSRWVRRRLIRWKVQSFGKSKSTNIFEIAPRNHKQLYFISNLNYFFRKGYGLLIALPWELTFDLALEKEMENVTHEVLVRLGISIGLTIILGYAGMKFVEILEDAHHHSNSHSIEQLLKGNHMKLKALT